MYAESLLSTNLPGGERGVKESEIFRAVRLVVDTGIHRKHWSHSQAIDYIRKHGRISDAECEAEVIRYTCLPGQALGYHVGRTIFTDIARAHAGDLANVHCRILKQGSVPMSILIRQFAKSMQ